MSYTYKYRFGWIPDLPDIRDYTDTNSKLYPMISKTKAAIPAPTAPDTASAPETTSPQTSTPDTASAPETTASQTASTPDTASAPETTASQTASAPDTPTLPGTADLRQWCSPVENQGNIGSCTANAVAAVVEYFENRSFNKYIDASRLFLYKVSRNLMHNTGDTGSYLKTTLGALVLFGMPPEEYWSYNESDFDAEPDAFCYSFANNYRCISYFRHDPAGATPDAVLESVKKYLATGIPSVFGFTVYQSISQADASGLIPFPGKNEKVMGGHAVAAVGYDDDKEIRNKISGCMTKGAILIRNSWSSTWGEEGYGWLPYEYILQGIALDWWSLLKQDWVDTGIFVEGK